MRMASELTPTNLTQHDAKRVHVGLLRVSRVLDDLLCIVRQRVRVSERELYRVSNEFATYWSHVDWLCSMRADAGVSIQQATNVGATAAATTDVQFQSRSWYALTS